MQWLLGMAWASSSVPEFEAPVKMIVDLVFIAIGSYVVILIMLRGADMADDRFEGMGRKLLALGLGIGFIVAARTLAQRWVGNAIAASVGPCSPALYVEACMDVLAMGSYYAATIWPAMRLWRRLRG